MIVGSVFQEIMRSESGELKDTSHLEGNPVEDEGGFAGFGEQMVKDAEDSEAEEDGAHKELNKSEREELIAIRNRIREIQKFMVEKGLSMADFEKSLLESNVGLQDPRQFVTGRDEDGLPVFKSRTGGEGSKGKENGCSTSGVKGHNSLGKEKNTSEVKVVKERSPSKKEVKFEYFPLEPGSNVVNPPDAVLLAGVEKLKCCLVGKFTRGVLPFKMVVEKAKAMWDRNGLVRVSHKDSRTYFFRFDSLESKAAILSRGTWFFGSEPVVLSEWGTKITDPVTRIPVWFRLFNIPDCYC